METPLRGRSGGHIGAAPTVRLGRLHVGRLISLGQIVCGRLMPLGGLRMGGWFRLVDCAWTVGIFPALFRPYASTHFPFYAFYFCSVYFFNG